MRLLASDAFDVAEGAGGASAEDADVPPPPALALPAPPEQYNLRERGDGAPPPPPPPPPLALGADGGLHDDFALLVEVYPVSSERQIKELYLEVNKAESVKEIDLPDAIAPTRKAHIDGACARLRAAYPGLFKPSERCKPPHLHLDTLRDRLFHCPALEHVGSAEELYTRLLALNRRLQARPAASWPERLRKPLEKATAHGCCLGLEDFSWLDSL